MQCRRTTSPASPHLPILEPLELMISWSAEQLDRHYVPDLGDFAAYKALYGVDEVELAQGASSARAEHLNAYLTTSLVALDDAGITAVGLERRTHLVQRPLYLAPHVGSLVHLSDYIGVSSAHGKRHGTGSRSRMIAAPEGRTGMKSDAEQTLLVIGAPQYDASAYHLSGFLAPDPVICLRVAGKKYLVVSSMELARELKSGGRALAAAAASLLQKLGATNSPVSVPPGLGVIYADELRTRSLKLTPDARLFAELRRAKTEEEISS